MLDWWKPSRLPPTWLTNYFNLIPWLPSLELSCSAAKSLQSCWTLCDPIHSSPPGSPVPGILQARTLEWVAISFSSARKSKVKVKLLSRVRLLATPWTAACQAPPSMGFSRQEYWRGVPLPSPTSFLICLCTCLFVSICYSFWSYTPSCGISSSWDMHVFKFSRNL